MGKHISIQVTLFNCKTCGVGYNNRITHVCRIPFSQLAQRNIRGKRAK